ncbi:MAG TPA: S8 family peptidase [Candidatus Ozemobacteraceae bacterium]|nr:S8 family peptidase [Candidatus Ozemobacteraceae bacterium]
MSFFFRCASLFFFLIAVVAGAAEIPPQPFEPVDWGRSYTSDQLSRSDARDGGLPNDPLLDKQYAWRNVGQADDKGQVGIPGCDVRLFDAWRVYKPKQEIILAIVDSGLDLQHEDIDPSCLWVNPGESGLDAQGRDKAGNGVDDDQNGYVDDVHGWNFLKNSPDIQEDHYHGTHVGGQLCARGSNGLGITGGFPGLRIMLVKVFGLGTTLSSEKFAEAIRYAVDNGAKVLSNSYGTPSYTSAMEAAVKYSHDHGTLFVCASGNSRKNMDLEEDKDYPSCYGFENQLVVGATNNRDLSTFSNFGSMVDVAAPGEQMMSTMPKNQYRSFSGTSQACPIAAAAACWVWSMNPQFTALDVKQRLLDSADELPGLRPYVRDGLRLNLYNALLGLPGRRLPAADYSTWATEERVIETSHPYYNNKVVTWDVSVEGAKAFRLHFSRMAIDHFGDTLEIQSRAGQVLAVYNINKDDFWTDAFDGDSVKLVFTANEYVGDYGFTIDRLQVRR